MKKVLLVFIISMGLVSIAQGNTFYRGTYMAMSGTPLMFGESTHVVAPGDTTKASTIAWEGEFHFQPWWTPLNSGSEKIEPEDYPVWYHTFCSIYGRMHYNYYKGDKFAKHRGGVRVGVSSNPIAEYGFHWRVFLDVNSKGIGVGMSGKGLGIFTIHLDSMTGSAVFGVIIPIPID